MKQLEQLYREIQANIYVFFYVKTSNSSIAEDLTHDVFYEACKGIASFQGKSTLQTWLFSIARNVLFKYYRSRKYRKNLTEQLQKEHQSKPRTPEKLVVINDETNNLLRKINTLNELQKVIVILHIYAVTSLYIYYD